MRLPEALGAAYVPALDGTFWIRPGNADGFWYSDGVDTERRLLDIVRQARDVAVGSMELAAAAADWPAIYHLTHERQNLLRPLADILAPRGGVVLEIGAGCGAITRYLGELGREKGFEVLALEGAASRAAVAAARCRDLDNVHVVADAIERFALPGPFAAVTLIGVLEYGDVIMPGGDGVGWLLDRAAALLAKDGLLVTAIENQMGLKYLAGAPEDHLGTPYYGLNDAYGPGQPVTFGRLELDGRLRRAGFAANRFLYPFPDYKTPTMIVTEAGAAARDMGLQALFLTAGAPSQGAAYLRLFSEERAWGVVHRNGLLPDLANSFLVASSTGGRLPDTSAPGDAEILCHIYSTARRRAFAKTTTLIRDSGGLRFERRALYPAAPPVQGLITQRIKTEPMIAGELFAAGGIARINRPGWTLRHLADWYAPFAVHLCQRARVTPAEATARGLLGVPLPKNHVDAVPLNAIRQEDGSFRFFDLEWIAATPPPLGFVMLRGLFHLISRLHSAASSQEARNRSILDLSVAILAEAGFPLSRREVEEAVFLEAQLQRVVIGEAARRLVLRRMHLAPLFLRPDAMLDCWLAAKGRPPQGPEGSGQPG